MRKVNRFFRFLPVLACLCAGTMFALILGVLVFGQGAFAFAYQNRSLVGNAVLFVIAAVVGAALWFAAQRWADCAAPAARRSEWGLAALFVAVLAVQLIIVRSTWHTMGWDVSVVYTTAEELARGQAVSNPSYFELCPNNAPITMLQYLPLLLAVKAGLGVPFMILPCLDALLLNLSAYFAVQCVRTLTQNRVARLFALILSIGWIALSPYMLFPYTDTFAILFPVLALFVYLRCKRPILKWFVVSLLCFFGAAVKPTVLIVLIALILLGVCRFVSQGDFSLKTCKRAAALVLAVLLGMAPGTMFQDAATAYLAGSDTPQGQLSETHYLMLGMNGDTYGGHSPGDVEFSQSYATLDQRRSANVQKAWERLTERTLGQNLHFFAVKTYKAYADGSFAAHDSFMTLEVPKRTDGLSLLLRSFYLPKGQNAPYAHTLTQLLWLGVLALCGVSCVLRRRNGAVAVLALTLLGLTAYLLLFEVWPRYLFLYAPFFVILAAMAFDVKKAPVD